MKAFLGMGLLGSNFVKAMLKKGDEVQVWNRTASKAEALTSFGAKVFATPAEAVKDADIVHIVVKDDAAVNEVLSAAQQGLKQGAIIIDHTTTSAEGAKQRGQSWKEKGFSYLHAPVFMGPSNALESSGYMLVSGDQQVIRKVENDLKKMTGSLLNLGDTEGKAAALKLAGNLFLLTLTTGLSDALAILKAQNVEGNELLDLFSQWNPGAGAPARLKKMLENNHSSPSWELNMARKDAGLMLSAAEKANTKLTLIPSIASLMDEWISKGHAHDDWTIISKDSL